MIILCHGGKFILQVYEGSKLVLSKSDSKYVIRAKSGGRQLNCDRSKNIMASTGSQMRRQNEILLQQHIDEFMEDAKTHIDQSKIIFLYAPGMNKLMFTAKAGHLYENRSKVKAVTFPSKKANY